VIAGSRQEVSRAANPFRQETMTTPPLPTLESTQFQEPELNEWPKPVSAYEKILRAEVRVLQDETNESIVSARVVGYLLLELYARRDILGERPYAKVIDEVVPAPQDRGYDKLGDNVLIFELGQQYRDHLIRACTFNYSSVFVV
jgi:hypothetical protein